MRILLLLLTFSVATIGLTGSSVASLAIRFTPVDVNDVNSEIRVLITGSGTVDTQGTSNPGATLNFDDFGIIFPGSTSDVSQTGLSIQFNGVDASTGNAYTATFVEFEVDDQGDGGSGDDINLFQTGASQFSFADGDTYSVNSTFTLTGTTFSALNSPATFTSNVVDGLDFGGVSFVSTIPEPTTSLMFATALSGVLVRRRRR